MTEVSERIVDILSFVVTLKEFDGGIKDVM